jgi:sulfotransferase
MASYDQFVCMSGLPRSGSTLLSALLSQNPKIHAEGNSAVCQLMWDMQQSYRNTCNEQINANNRQDTIQELIAGIPRTYYNKIDSEERVIVDKCRSWSLPDNMDLLKNYIDKNIKVIMLERSIVDIVKSFCKLYKKNNQVIQPDMFLQEGSEPLMRSLHGLLYAKHNNHSNNFLFISYEDLVTSPQETMDRIYEFCGWEPFVHDFTHIVPKYVENDSFYNLKGFHDVRSSIEVVQNTTVLPPDIISKCDMIENIRLHSI